MAFSVPLVAAASEEEAIRLAYEAMKIGADAVMTQWSPRLIAAVTEAGVPVQAHAGLVHEEAPGQEDSVCSWKNHRRGALDL